MLPMGVWMFTRVCPILRCHCWLCVALNVFLHESSDAEHQRQQHVVAWQWSDRTRYPASLLSIDFPLSKPKPCKKHVCIICQKWGNLNQKIILSFHVETCFAVHTTFVGSGPGSFAASLVPLPYNVHRTFLFCSFAVFWIFSFTVWL